MKFAAGTGAGVQCKFIISRCMMSPCFQSMAIKYWSVLICVIFWRGLLISEGKSYNKSKQPLKFITTGALTAARYLSVSRTNVCRERRSLWGERSEASPLPAAFKVTAEKQRECESSSTEFPNKYRKKSIALKRGTRPAEGILKVLAVPFPMHSLVHFTLPYLLYFTSLAILCEPLKEWFPSRFCFPKH